MGLAASQWKGVRDPEVALRAKPTHRDTQKNSTELASDIGTILRNCERSLLEEEEQAENSLLFLELELASLRGLPMDWPAGLPTA